jgi:hypothetical protein
MKKPIRLANPPRADFGILTLSAQVRAAMPVARALIEEGIDYGVRADDSWMERVADFMDDQEFLRFCRECSEQDSARWADRLEAARAIGIALGLMLRHEAFEGGA